MTKHTQSNSTSAIGRHTAVSSRGVRIHTISFINMEGFTYFLHIESRVAPVSRSIGISIPFTVPKLVQSVFFFSDEAHFWLNGYGNKQNCRIWSEANPQVYVETPLHPEKLTVWCALWAGGILLQKR
ncbi:hypothetical protein TNCV_731261 [Trichonephila clavipes]|nr:hypothetical protein TNCV_731261 [Trichonephila clavipes]